MEEKRKLEEEEERIKANRKKKPNSSSRFYESSDEEDNEEESKETESIKKPKEATGLNVLKKIKSFSSSVWADSDQEDVDEEYKDDNEDEDGEYNEDEALLEDGDIDNQNLEDGAEAARNYEILSEVVGKQVSRHQPRPAPKPDINYMPRFDPDAEEEEEEEAESDVDDSDKPALDTQAKYEVTQNLKAAFSQPSNKGFSFGFGQAANKVEEVEKTETANSLFKLDDEDAEVKVEKDFSETFGSQLKGKSNQSSEAFFFDPEDQRFSDAMQFFFTDRPDLEKVREEYNSKRPELAAIIKKKARSKAQFDRNKIQAKNSRFGGRRGGGPRKFSHKRLKK